MRKQLILEKSKEERLFFINIYLLPIYILVEVKISKHYNAEGMENSFMVG